MCPRGVRYIHYISPTRVPMATKLGRMMTCLIGFLPIKSLDPLIKWSCEITWQTISIITSILQCQWLPNFAGWWLNLRGSYRFSHLTLYLFGLTWCPDKVKTLAYLSRHRLCYCNTWGYQTWQGGSIPWRPPTHKNIWSLNHKVW